jgi:hypothetical protein
LPFLAPRASEEKAFVTACTDEHRFCKAIGRLKKLVRAEVDDPNRQLELLFCLEWLETMVERDSMLLIAERGGRRQ